jgi:hypothetical protein
MAAPASAKAAGDKRVWKLPRESELRFEVAADKTFTVVVSSSACKYIHHLVWSMF